MRNLGIQSERKRCILPTNSTTPQQQQPPPPEEAAFVADGDGSRRLVDVCSVTVQTGGDHHSEDDLAAATCLLTSDGRVSLVNSEDAVLWERDLSEIGGGNSSSSSNENAKGEWFSMTSVEPTLVCLNLNGSIVSIQPDNGEAELVGEFENGIAAAAWSPDRQVLVLLTAAEDDDDPEQTKSVLLSMNAQWDVLAEVAVDKIKEDGDDAMVSLCWTNALFAVNSVDQADGMRKIRLYQGDTLALHAVGRTEDGSGKLAPNLVGTEMSWAGTACSHVLAAVQRKGKSSKHVAFFEPNGLRHREFLLRDDGFDVTGLQWNTVSDLLAVTLLQGDQAKVQLWHRSNYHWYMKYERRLLVDAHHAPKVKFHDEDPYLLYILLDSRRWMELQVRWDVSTVLPTTTITTTALSVDGCCLNLTDFEQSFVPPPMYAYTLPMEAPVCEIAISREITSPVYGVVSLANGTLVLLGRNKKSSYPLITALATFVCRTTDFDWTSLRNLVHTKQEDTGICLLAIATSWKHPGRDFLVELTLPWSTTGNGGEPVVTGSHTLDDRCLTLTTWSDSRDGALIQLHDGSLLEYEVDADSKGSLTRSSAEATLEPCPWLAALKNVDNFGGHHCQRLIVGMSARYRLYCNDFLIADLISYFSLSPENQFLCYVTAGSSCVLRFVSLKDLATFDPLSGSDENIHVLQGYEPRTVERGSRLVAVLARKPSVVLQMPRGNLEIVYPRALVLRHVMLKTKERQYREAFELMRKQKVDFNLLVDMHPFYFLEQGGVTALVEQIVNIDHLNLFIACLQNWDSTKDRFIIPHWIVKDNGDNCAGRVFDFITKVNQVCLSIRAVMMESERNGRTVGGRLINEGHFLLPILSTFAKEDPPNLQNALQMILENAQRKHSDPSTKPPLFSETAQSSIQYLAFLADYELLFETALGMYDFDMARAVGRNSQMDPKSYLPLLQRYRGLPIYYGRFQVDMRLNRFDSALRNLTKSGTVGEVVTDTDRNGFVQSIRNDFDACMQLIEKQQLYRLGLELYEGKLQRNRIMLSLGDQLMASKQAETALCVFLAADPVDEERCVRAATEAMDWAILFSLPSTKNDLQKQQRLAREIADDLAASSEGSFNRRDILGSASRVLLDYGGDVAGAVEILILAESWSEGKRIGYLHSRDDLSRKVIDEAVSYAYTAISDFDERIDAFLQASKRYDEVLQIRKEAILAGGGSTGNDLQHEDNGSLFSAATNASNLSIKSSASTGSVGSLSSVISIKSTSSFTLSGGDDTYRHKSKFNQLGRQKHKKKKKGKGSRIRPGSEEELQGLVCTLKSNCIDEGYSQTVGETIAFLVQNCQLSVARALFDKHVSMCKKVSDAKEERIRIHQNSSNFKDNDLPQEIFTHSVEAEVDALACSSLPITLHELFKFFPSWQS